MRRLRLMRGRDRGAGGSDPSTAGVSGLELPMMEIVFGVSREMFPGRAYSAQFLHKNNAENRQFASENPLRQAGMLVNLVTLGIAIPQSAVVGRA
jgi:hypothetical protein